jgi:hypothetical protein
MEPETQSSENVVQSTLDEILEWTAYLKQKIEDLGFNAGQALGPILETARIAVLYRSRRRRGQSRSSRR